MQPFCLLAVDGCYRGAEPFDGLQLSPAVTELAEHRQALLGEPLGGGIVAADHRELCACAQGRRYTPLVAGRPEARDRVVKHGLGHRAVAEIRRDEGMK